jgi:hypothetical protein
MQPFSHSGSRNVALVPIIVAMPPINDVDAVNVVTHVQQYVDRLTDAAAKVEHARAGRQRFPQPYKKAQVRADGLAPLVASHYDSLSGQRHEFSAVRLIAFAAVRQSLSDRSTCYVTSTHTGGR